MDRMTTLSAGETEDGIKTMEFFGGKTSRAEELWGQVFEEIKAIDADLAFRVDDLRCAMVSWAWDIGFARAVGESNLGTLTEDQRSQLVGKIQT
jgi:hypothetical protein